MNTEIINEAEFFKMWDSLRYDSHIDSKIAFEIAVKVWNAQENRIAAEWD